MHGHLTSLAPHETPDKSPGKPALQTVTTGLGGPGPRVRLPPLSLPTQTCAPGVGTAQCRPQAPRGLSPLALRATLQTGQGLAGTGLASPRPLLPTPRLHPPRVPTPRPPGAPQGEAGLTSQPGPDHGVHRCIWAEPEATLPGSPAPCPGASVTWRCGLGPHPLKSASNAALESHHETGDGQATHEGKAGASWVI